MSTIDSQLPQGVQMNGEKVTISDVDSVHILNAHIVTVENAKRVFAGSPVHTSHSTPKSAEHTAGKIKLSGEWDEVLVTDVDEVHSNANQTKVRDSETVYKCSPSSKLLTESVTREYENVW